MEPTGQAIANGEQGRAVRLLSGAPLEAVEPKQIRLTREDGWMLVLHLPDGRTCNKVQVARAAPLSDPDHYISFLDEHGEEICMVRDPSQLDAQTRQLLQEELDRRYLTAVVRRIYSIRTELGVSYFDVETSRGRREFVVQSIHEKARELGDGRLLLVDVDGNRFEVPDPNNLDKKSARLLRMTL